MFRVVLLYISHCEDATASVRLVDDPSQRTKRRLLGELLIAQSKAKNERQPEYRRMDRSVARKAISWGLSRTGSRESLT